jgi:3-phenylpropionate/trans-cinnamate dioxygenase ferredoxin reductase subunit
MPANETYVIVGAGLAGAKAAEALRDEGFDGRVVLIGDEPARPYERPPLSKAYLRGEAAHKPFVHPPQFYADQRIELMTSTRVTGIDAGLRELLLEGDRRLGYDRLLLTTGAAPRGLEVPGADLEGVHYLRTLADSEAIAARLERGRHLVVVGSGWIGAEIAASARQRGCEVTMLEMGSLPLERVLGPEVGRVYLDLHRDHGVQFLAQTTVERFEGEGRIERAEAAGIKVDNGILVDEGLQTSVGGIFAAGDVANALNPFYGHPLRVEHWANALNQGPVAARAMLGKPARYEEIPYFFSDQYDTGMEYSGYATEWDEVVFRGDVAAREFIALWVKERRVVAGMNMNVWDVSDPLRELIRSRRAVDSRDLADPELPLSQLVQSEAADDDQAEVLGACASEGGPS